MAQDFWASSGFRLLAAAPAGLVLTDAWLARFLEREELSPPPDAGPRERALHERLAAAPRSPVARSEIEALEDPDARENWAAFVRFRDRLLAHETLEAAYVDLFARGDVDVAPVFVDALAQVLTRAALDGVEDPYWLRAGEMFFRRQRVSTEAGQVLAADAATLEMYADTGGFGAVGRLLRESIAPVKMDVLTRENAAFYWLRDELYSFALDLTPGREGVQALARVLERWVARLAGVRVAIEPRARIEDDRWRWHVGLDAEASAILNALYGGEPVSAEVRGRLIALFRLEFADPADVRADVAGHPVYLALAARADRTLKLKPQNLLLNLPLAGRDRPPAG
jgi:hypothetical protein